MSKITPENWSVSLFAKEIEIASAGSENFNTVLVHPEIIERDFKLCCKEERELDIRSLSPVYKVTCKKGLWMVEGTDQEYIKNQAKHYFIQYWSDGEYDDILDAMDNES
jgi:hypothetical protein